jgi:CRISPR system Cascade subunit CasE
MYFSKIELRRDADANRLPGLLGGNEYRDHQMLWKFFPGVEKRNFIFRREEQSVWPCFYVVSEQKPVEDSAAVWTVQTKEYKPQIKAGQRLAFSLRVNPVRSKTSGEKEKRGVRHDVVMDAKNCLKKDGIPKDQWKPMSELVAEEGWKWLSVRTTKHGFTVEKETTRTDGYRQHWLSKRGNKPIRFSTLDFQGILVVEDPGKFQEVLYQGVGPAKGFGCGLLMIRRL